MSAVAVDTRLSRPLRFYETTVGKKVIMAVTGFILFGFLIAHMIGNLQVFAGPEKLNHYAVALREIPAVLWAARLGLLLAVILHITAAIQLWAGQRAARPVAYVKKVNDDSSLASRTMIWGGIAIALFVVYHLMHFTWIVFPGYEHLRPYENIVTGFQNPLISIIYIAAVIALAMHLYHGLWSMFQTLGLSHPRYTPMLKRLAAIFTVVLAGGFISVPVSVLLGIVS